MYFCPQQTGSKDFYRDNRPHGCVGERLWLRLLRDIGDHVLGTPQKMGVSGIYKRFAWD